MFTVLHRAFQMEKQEIRDFLLSNQDCQIDPINALAMTPLFYAINKNDKIGVKGLLNRNASCL